MQQIARNVTMEGCGVLWDCRYLLHDRDTKYTLSFPKIPSGLGVASSEWLTDHRGVSLGISSHLLGAGQRPCLRTCLHVPGEGNGHPRPTDLASIALAKSVCRASDWYRAARVLGPGADLRRGASAANSFFVCGLLQ